MIDVALTRAEALLIVELVKKNAQELSNAILIAVEEGNDKEQMAIAAKQNYVKNLEQALGVHMKLKENPIKPQSTYSFCLEQIKDMKVGETRQIKRPHFTTYKKFRTGLSAAASNLGRFKTKGSQSEEIVTVTKLEANK